LPQAAPLIGIPAAPVPDDGAAEWFEGSDGVRLRAALFRPKGVPRGSVVVSPGRTEAIEKYFEVVRELQQRGFVVLVHDWRGQGLSARLLPDRLKGHARGFRPFIHDLKELVDTFADRLPQPWLTIGHSMGGCLTLLALALGEERFAGAILSAPMLGLLTGPIPRPVGIGLSMGLTAIGLGGFPVAARSATPVAVDFEDNIVTHDVARYERNQAQIDACPDLALGGPTWGWLNFAFTAIGMLGSGRAVTQIKTPLVVLGAMDDKIINVEETRRITARVPGSRFVETPGAYHEILQETDAIRAIFWREFDALAARVGAAPRALAS
jgi:lysophospholipase